MVTTVASGMAALFCLRRSDSPFSNSFTKRRTLRSARPAQSKGDQCPPTRAGLSTSETGSRASAGRSTDRPPSGLDEPARVDGTLIETTWSHPFYIRGKGWVKAEDLVQGDISQTEGNGSLKITKIHVDVRGEEVYNFEVEEDHNYYVSEAGVLVHNESYEPSKEMFKIIALVNDKADMGLGMDELNLLLAGAVEASPELSAVLASIQAKMTTNDAIATSQLPSTVLDDQIAEQKHELSEAIAESDKQLGELDASYQEELERLYAMKDSIPMEEFLLRHGEMRERYEMSLQGLVNLKRNYETKLKILSSFPVDSADQPLGELTTSIKESIVQGMAKELYGKNRLDITMSNEVKKARELQTALYCSSAIDYVQGVAGLFIPCKTPLSCGAKYTLLWTLDVKQKQEMQPYAYEFFRPLAKRKRFMQQRPLLKRVRSFKPVWPSTQDDIDNDLQYILPSTQEKGADNWLPYPFN